MQSVNAAFTAEEKDSVRNIDQNLLVSWKKEDTLSSRTFTIGVSTIGGNDIIGANPGGIGNPGNYRYFDESEYVLSLGWEHSLKMPIGGLAKGFAEATLDNTSGRFTPRYMGGTSELYTATNLPRRPFIINAGFDVAGTPITIPQFSGVLTKPPMTNKTDATTKLVGSDYIDFLEGRYLDDALMFTGITTDQVMENRLQALGLTTAQYELDPGINVIPFGYFPKGITLGYLFDKLAESENGHFYQDESGVLRFENRQHWDSSPYNQVSAVIQTAQVLETQAPDTDHIINVVEVKSEMLRKQSEQIIFRLNPFDNIELAANTVTEVFVEFEDPALSMTVPTGTGTQSFFQANSQPDASGTDLTSSVSVFNYYKFANSVKLNFNNTSSQIAYLTNLVITGRPAKKTGDLYTRNVRSSSLTAFEEHKLEINNPFIQDPVWAQSLAEMLLNDYAQPENLQVINIRAMPRLQRGDLVSWQGRYWRIFEIRALLSPTDGFVQELTLLQRTPVSYFRIGISTVGGTDKIAP